MNFEDTTLCEISETQRRILHLMSKRHWISQDHRKNKSRMVVTTDWEEGRMWRFFSNWYRVSF